MSEAVKRPVLVGFFAVFVGLEICVLLFSIVIVALATPDSTIQIVGDSMVIGKVRYMLLAVLLLLVALAVFVGVGLWRGKSAARHLFFASIVAAVLVTLFERGQIVELPVAIIVCGLSAWYLYRKPNVKEFFLDRESS